MNEKRRLKQIVLKSKPKLRLTETTGSTTDSSDESNSNIVPDFLLSSTKILNDLRKSRIFTDIDLECIGSTQTYSAHSVVLASSSGFFRSYFTSQLQEFDTTPQNKRSKSSIFKDITPIRRFKISLEIKPETLLILLDFMYTGCLFLPLDSNQLKIIISSAHKLKIPKFVSCVVDSLRSRLSIATHALLWDVAVDLDRRELREEVIHFVAKRFDQLTESGELFSLPFARLKAVCQHMQSGNDSHEEVLSAILSWVKHDPKREKDLPTLLRFVDVTCLSSVYIAVLVKTESLVRTADRFWNVLSSCHVERINLNKKIMDYFPLSIKQANVSEHIRLRSSLRKDLSTKPTLASAKSATSSVRVHATPKRTATSITNTARLSNQQQKQQTVDDDALSPRSRRFLSKNKRYLYEAMSTLDLQSEAMGDASRKCDIKKPAGFADVKRRSSAAEYESRKVKCSAGTMAILGRSRNGNTLMQFLCLERKVWHVPEDPCEMFISMDYVLPRKAACTVNGPLFFILGGLLSDGKVVATSVVYDYQSSVFSKRNSMKHARYNSGAAILDGYLYVIGGLDERTLISKVERNLLFIDEWEDLSPIPTAGEQIVSAVVDKQIYCVSICRVSSQQMCCSYYVPKTDQWTLVKFLPPETVNESQLLMASHNNHLYALLWRSLPMIPLSITIYYYNVELKEWEHVRYSGFAPKRDMVAVLSNKNALWIVDMEGVLYKFSVRKCRWESFLPSLPVLTTPLYAGIVCAYQ